MSPATTAPATSTVAIEGENKGTYPDGHAARLGDHRGRRRPPSTLGRAMSSPMTTQGARYVVPGYGTIDIRPEGGKPVLTAPEPIPDWISVAENKVSRHHRCRPLQLQPLQGRNLQVRTGVGAVVLHPRQPVLRQVLWRTRGSGHRPATGSTRPARTSATWSANSGPTRCGGTATWPGRSSRRS